jgi:bifunctional non-homologous end joining protein LigD
MQIYVPLNTKTSYEQTKPFAQAIARLLEQEHPDLVVSDMKKAIRTNKVFVDWSQNDQHKTTIAVYSLRAREHPTVSTPITWDEVEQALKKKDPQRLVFEATAVLKRVEEVGDLFAPLLNLKQKLPQLAGLVAAAEKPAKEKEESVAMAAQAESRPRSRSKAAKTVSKRRKV